MATPYDLFTDLVAFMHNPTRLYPAVDLSAISVTNNLSKTQRPLTLIGDGYGLAVGHYAPFVNSTSQFKNKAGTINGGRRITSIISADSDIAVVKVHHFTHQWFPSFPIGWEPIAGEKLIAIDDGKRIIPLTVLEVNEFRYAFKIDNPAGRPVDLGDSGSPVLRILPSNEVHLVGMVQAVRTDYAECTAARLSPTVRQAIRAAVPNVRIIDTAPVVPVTPKLVTQAQVTALRSMSTAHQYSLPTGEKVTLNELLDTLLHFYDQSDNVKEV